VQLIGACEAGAIEKWLKANAATRGPIKLKPETLCADLMLAGVDRRDICVPLELRCGILKDVDGREWLNRARFCFITVRRDLNTNRAYLHRNRDR
jgi:hypothetical protein